MGFIPGTTPYHQLPRRENRQREQLDSLGSATNIMFWFLEARQILLGGCHTRDIRRSGHSSGANTFPRRTGAARKISRRDEGLAVRSKF